MEKGGNLKNHPPLQKLKGEAFPVLLNGVTNPASATSPFQIYRFNLRTVVSSYVLQ